MQQRDTPQDYRFLIPQVHSAPVNNWGEVATSIPYRLEADITPEAIRRELGRQPHMRQLAQALDPQRKVYLLHSASQELLELAAQYIGTFHRLSSAEAWLDEDMVLPEDEEEVEEAEQAPEDTADFHFDFSAEMPCLEQFEVCQFYGGNFFAAAGRFGLTPQERGRRTPWWFHNAAAPLAIRGEGGSFAACAAALPSLRERRELLIFMCQEQSREAGFSFAGDQEAWEDRAGVRDLAFELETEILELDTPQPDCLYKRQVLCQLARQQGSRIPQGKTAAAIARLIQSSRGDADNRTFSKAISNALLRRRRRGALSLRDFDYLRELRSVRGADASSPQRPLVGQEEVRAQLRKVVDTLAFQKRRRDLGLASDPIHCTFAFLGAPGTGKTTWALRLADEMCRLGLLESTESICLNAAELKARYVGHTTGRVKAIFEQYSVIILDEAYSLTEEGDADCYTREALAQLCVELERHASDRLVVFADYGGSGDPREDRMLRFLQCNPGLSSRVAFKIRFADFQPPELFQVFDSMLSQEGYALPEGSEGAVEDFFARLKGARTDFGNCREARNLADRVKVHLSARLAGTESLSREAASQVTKEDLTGAMAEILREEAMLRRPAPSIGF